jgi:hypothetical protein
MYLNSFRQLAAAYPRVVISQRILFPLQEDYVATLVTAWRRVIENPELVADEGGEANGHDMPGRSTTLSSDAQD